MTPKAPRTVDEYSAAFPKELESYTCSKGAVQFPLGSPVPLDLLQRMVWFGVQDAEPRRLTRRRRKA